MIRLRRVDDAFDIKEQRFRLETKYYSADVSARRVKAGHRLNRSSTPSLPHLPPFIQFAFVWSEADDEKLGDAALKSLLSPLSQGVVTIADSRSVSPWQPSLAPTRRVDQSQVNSPGIHSPHPHPTTTPLSQAAPMTPVERWVEALGEQGRQLELHVVVSHCRHVPGTASSSSSSGKQDLATTLRTLPVAPITFHPSTTGFIGAADDWAADHLFEHVPCDLFHPALTATAREKAGVARLVEVIECVAWNRVDAANKNAKPRSVAAGPLPALLHVCCVCGRQRGDGVRILLCSRCRSVGYCGADCQRGDWPSHKVVCGKAAVAGGASGQAAGASEEERERALRERAAQEVERDVVGEEQAKYAASEKEFLRSLQTKGRFALSEGGGGPRVDRWCQRL